MNTTSKLLLTGLISVVMTGCNNQSSTTTGSSTNTSPTTSSPSADTSEPSVAVTQASVIQALGEIDGFGSVIVNGKHYETDNAEITVDGEPALEESLDTGMIVEVIAEEGQDGKIHAKEVRFSSKIAGFLQGVDAERRVLTIMRKNIVIDGDTKLSEEIDEVSLEPMEQGVKVRVSGYRNDEGEIVASRVDLLDSAKPSRLSGSVNEVDSDNSKLVIDGQTIDFSNATMVGKEGGAKVGDKVSVQGEFDADTFRAEGELIVHSAEKNSKKVHVKGLVKKQGNGDVSIGGKKLIDLDKAVWTNGEQDDIKNGMRVSVEGEKKANGDIQVKEIVVEMAAVIREMGEVEEIDSASSTVSMGGKTYQVSEDTDFHDTGSNKVRQFDMEDMALGDRVIVNGFRDRNGEFKAKRITRVGDDQRGGNRRIARLHTTVAEVVNESTLLTTDGVTVNLTETTRVSRLVDLNDAQQEVLIKGRYNEDKSVTARFIRSLNRRPAKGDEPRPWSTPEGEIDEIKRETAQIERSLEQFTNPQLRRLIQIYNNVIQKLSSVDPISDNHADGLASTISDLEQKLAQVEAELAQRLPNEDGQSSDDNANNNANDDEQRPDQSSDDNANDDKQTPDQSSDDNANNNANNDEQRPDQSSDDNANDDKQTPDQSSDDNANDDEQRPDQSSDNNANNNANDDEQRPDQSSDDNANQNQDVEEGGDGNANLPETRPQGEPPVTPRPELTLDQLEQRLSDIDNAIGIFNRSIARQEAILRDNNLTDEEREGAEGVLRIARRNLERSIQLKAETEQKIAEKKQ